MEAAAPAATTDVILLPLADEEEAEEDVFAELEDELYFPMATEAVFAAAVATGTATAAVVALVSATSKEPRLFDDFFLEAAGLESNSCLKFSALACAAAIAPAEPSFSFFRIALIGFFAVTGAAIVAVFVAAAAPLSALGFFFDFFEIED